MVARRATSLGARVDHLVSLNDASRFRERLLDPDDDGRRPRPGRVRGRSAVMAHTSGWSPRARRAIAFLRAVGPGRPAGVLPGPRLPPRGARAPASTGWSSSPCRSPSPAAPTAASARGPARPRLALVIVLAVVGRRARRRRDDRVAPQPQRRLRVLADGQLPALRHQQLLLRPAGDGRLPAGRGVARGRAARSGRPAAGRRPAASPPWSCWACRSGAPTSAASSPSRRRSSCSRLVLWKRRIRLRAAGPGRRRATVVAVIALRAARPGPPARRAGPPRPAVRAGGGRGARAALLDHRAQAARQPPGVDLVAVGRRHPDRPASCGCTWSRYPTRPYRGCGPSSRPCRPPWPPPSWPRCWAAPSTTRAPSSGGVAAMVLAASLRGAPDGTSRRRRACGGGPTTVRGASDPAAVGCDPVVITAEPSPEVPLTDGDDRSGEGAR